MLEVAAVQQDQGAFQAGHHGGGGLVEVVALMWQDERVRWSGRKLGNFGGLGWFGEYGDLAVRRSPTIGLPRALSGLSKQHQERDGDVRVMGALGSGSTSE